MAPPGDVTSRHDVVTSGGGPTKTFPQEAACLGSCEDVVRMAYSTPT
jgi:hypothetical protein